MSKKKKSIYDRVPRAKEILSYYRLWVDGKADAASQGNPFLVKSDAEETSPKSEGKDNGSVVGCNLNNWNANASVRTLNGNNYAGNGNDNYVGASAVKAVDNIVKRENLASQAASLKITDGCTANGACRRCDYGFELPFYGGEEVKAESNALGYRKNDPIFTELKAANSKRKIKNTKRFVLSRVIILKGFERTMERTHCSAPVKEWYEKHKLETCAYIWYLLYTQTYVPLPNEKRIIHKRGKGDKDRNADISDVFDRIIHNIILIVIEDKFRNKLTRNVYSGIKQRSLLSNNPTYCMINIIRHWVATHQGAYVGLTDIRHFYENTYMKVVFSVMFQTIVCPYMRWLLIATFSKTEKLPIGGSLSQLMAMVTISECDRLIIEKFHVFLCCFGDNRLIGDYDKTKVRKAMEFQMSFYEGRYCLSVKGDYQIHHVVQPFRFCKYDYFKSFVKPRAEIRRRAIRAWRKGRQHYAGYNGILKKTDSKHLQHLIENHIVEITNDKGMKSSIQRGCKKKHKGFPEDTVIIPVEYVLSLSDLRMSDDTKRIMKEKGITEEEAKKLVPKTYFVKITYIAIPPDRHEPILCHSTESSNEIVEFYNLVKEGKTPLRQRLHLGIEGNKLYYKEYHVTAKDAIDYLKSMDEFKKLIY